MTKEYPESFEQKLMASTAVISEGDLTQAELEPSIEFRRLLGRFGYQMGIGSIGSGIAIRDLVMQRAAKAREQTLTDS